MKFLQKLYKEVSDYEITTRAGKDVRYPRFACETGMVVIQKNFLVGLEPGPKSE